MANNELQRVVMGLWICLACSLVGCTPSATGAFDDKGYQHTAFGYRVDATHASDPNIAKENLLGTDWKLDNFYSNASNALVPKATDEYLTEYEFDTDGDGKSDFTKEDFLYDLRFKHLKRDALIWLRTIPLSNDLKDKELRVLVQRYVDEVSGAGFEAVKLGPTTTLLREKRFGASVVDRGAFKLAAQDAYETTFDVANVDQVAVSPNSRRVRVRIVLVRTPFQYSAGPSSYSSDGKVYKFSVLMLAGYANLPEDFATDEKDFQQLLDHTSISGKHGTTAIVFEGSPSSAAPDAKASAAGAEQPATVAPEAPVEPAAPSGTTPPQ